MPFRCKLCGAERHGRVYGLGVAPRRYQAAECVGCGLFQVLYDWTAAPPPAITTAFDVESSDWVSDAEMAAHADKAGDFADRLAQAGWLAGSAVLDVGCGEGHFLEACAKRGAQRVTGHEFRLASMRYARERCGIGDLRSAPLTDRTVWPDAEFDLVCSFDVIEHVHDLDAFFAQCLRVLKPGGRMLHASPGADSITHRLGRVFSRLGAGRLAGTLCNVQFVEDLLGGPHVHLMGRQSLSWLARHRGLVARGEYVSSYSYSDQHYAATVPQLRWLPRPLGATVFRIVRHTIRNKLVIWAERAPAG